MNGEYIASALEPSSWPQLLTPQRTALPEAAIVGRSNVGKSSLINYLSPQRHPLAKVSSLPGKTQRLQFFCFDRRYLLVDLPGYGFAHVSSRVRAQWSDAIDLYLKVRPLRLILLLLDIRRLPSADDRNMALWALQKPVPLLPVFTKTDLVNSLQLSFQSNRILSELSLSGHDHLHIQQPSRKIWSTILRYLDKPTAATPSVTTH
jgi:GTP-binding protein